MHGPSLDVVWSVLMLGPGSCCRVAKTPTSQLQTFTDQMRSNDICTGTFVDFHTGFIGPQESSSWVVQSVPINVIVRSLGFRYFLSSLLWNRDTVIHKHIDIAASVLEV
ncbi:hypothetical protein EV426DRAFT_611828 [Tirmania nivea]|nr:hypothetical protein EV426DRAFT_611828 [Tirmania nivea]